MISSEPPSDTLTPADIEQLQDVFSEHHLDYQLDVEDGQVTVASSPLPHPDSAFLLTSINGMDQIEIRGIRSYGYTGYLPEEKVLGQWFTVDLFLWLDLSQVGLTDQIQDTIDYRLIISRVKYLLKSSQFSLVERLANAIAFTLLEEHPLLSQINVQLTKVAPPIEDFSGQITINITRHR